MDTKTHKYTFLKEAHSLFDTLKAHRRFFHANAETGFDTEKSKAYIAKELSRLSIPSRPCGGGLVAAFGEGDANVLLRAEIDALPIREENAALPFAAKENMHACGHDMHTAMLLGAAQLIQKHREKLAGKVTFLFQSAEETLSGARAMIADGALDGAPTAAFALHVLTASPYPTGTLLFPPEGKITPAADFFTVTVNGKGAHGAMPDEGNDPLTAAAHLLLGLQSLVPQSVGVDKEALLTVGVLRGGDAANAIPNTATLSGTLRTHDEATRRFLKERISLFSTRLCEAFSCRAALSWDAECPALAIDGRVRREALSAFRHLYGKERIKEIPPFGGKPKGGSEDFSYFAEKLPSLFVTLCAGESSHGYEYPLHHPKANFDEAALPYGAAAYAAFAFSITALRADESNAAQALQKADQK